MLHRQRGLSLLLVALFSAALALVAVAALFSMRYERNVFAEVWAKVTGNVAANVDLDAARRAATGEAPKADPNMIRKCVIDGKTVISNTDCTDKNPTSRTVKTFDTRGYETKGAPPPASSAPTSDPMLDKAIEKATR
jgi:hypothetical protein